MKMARKTKAMLEQEVRSLEIKVEELRYENRKLNVDKDYWFVNYEICRYEKEENYNPHTLHRLRVMDEKVTEMREDVKRFNMKERILDVCYGLDYFEDSL